MSDYESALAASGNSPRHTDHVQWLAVGSARRNANSLRHTEVRAIDLKITLRNLATCCIANNSANAPDRFFRVFKRARALEIDNTHQLPSVEHGQADLPVDGTVEGIVNGASCCISDNDGSAKAKHLADDAGPVSYFVSNGAFGADRGYDFKIVAIRILHEPLDIAARLDRPGGG